MPLFDKRHVGEAGSEAATLNQELSFSSVITGTAGGMGTEIL